MRRLGLSRTTYMNDKLRRLGREAYEAKRKPTPPVATTPKSEEEIKRILVELDDREIPGAPPTLEEDQPQVVEENFL